MESVLCFTNMLREEIGRVIETNSLGPGIIIQILLTGLHTRH